MEKSSRRVYRTWVFLLFCVSGTVNADTPEARWNQLQDEGSRFREQGKYEEARRTYTDALAIAESFGGTDSRLGQTLNNLAAACFDGGHYTEAEAYYLRVVDIWKPNLSVERDRDLASLWSNLAALYVATERYAQAEPLYRRALALTDRAIDDLIPLRITLTNNLAEMYRNQGRFKEAEPLFQEALAYWQSKPDSTALAMVLNNLAALYTAQRRYDEAEKDILQALHTYEKLVGPKHPKTATCLSNLADLYPIAGSQCGSSLPLLRRALAIREGGAEPATSRSGRQPE